MKACFTFLLLFGVMAWAGPGEYHWTICGVSPAEAKRRLSATVEKSQRRQLYYLDTSRLDLFRAGVVLRLRAEKGEPVEVTVKLETSPKSVGSDFLSDEGFKCEEDFHGRNSAVQCSLTKKKIDVSDLKDYLKGKLGAEELFTKKQHAYLASQKVSVPWRSLKVFGPVDNLKWKLDSTPADIVMELLTASSDTKLFELSQKAPASSSSEFRKIGAQLTAKGIPLCPKQTGAAAWTLGAP